MKMKNLTLLIKSLKLRFILVSSVFLTFLLSLSSLFFLNEPKNLALLFIASLILCVLTALSFDKNGSEIAARILFLYAPFYIFMFSPVFSGISLKLWQRGIKTHNQGYLNISNIIFSTATTAKIVLFFALILFGIIYNIEPIHDFFFPKFQFFFKKINNFLYRSNLND